MKVNGIVVPLISAEICHLKTWLSSCPPSGKTGAVLYLSIDMAWDEYDKCEIMDTFSRCRLSQEGWRVVFIECQMAADESFYVKDGKKHVDVQRYPYGQKSGPNMQFFRTIRALRAPAEELGGVLLMEVDAFPVVDGWNTQLDAHIANFPNDALLAGARYAGSTNLAAQIRSHFNGNSAYFIGRSDFFTFLDAWERLLLKCIQMAPHLAYDVAIPWFMNYRATHPGVRSLEDQQTEYLVASFNERCFDLSSYLVNYGGTIENSDAFCLDVPRFVADHPDALVVHGKCFDHLVSTIKAALTNQQRKCLLNVLHDLICCGSYDDAVLFGVRDFHILRSMIGRIEMLTERQVAVIERGWR